MSNNYFAFKQFTVKQALCAMKVGTDGTLLGAWAAGGLRILDVGTGTALIALMMAQRFPEARIVSIDIDDGAFEQARENVLASPFPERIMVIKQDVKALYDDKGFDAIVCNPPYFVDSLPSPDEQRSIARHAVTLTYRELVGSVWRLLADDGIFSVVVPFNTKDKMEAEALLMGFFKCRECAVRTSSLKPPRRYLMSFSKHNKGLVKESLLMGDGTYKKLMNDFYIK